MKRCLFLLPGLFLLCPVFAGPVIEYKTPDTIYFNGVQEGDVLKGNIKFVNRTEQPVQLMHVRTSCGCTVADYNRDPGPPGESASISYKWNTRGFKEHSSKTITLEFVQGNIQPKAFRLEANIDHYIMHSPMYLAFRKVHAFQDTVIEKEFTIVNKLKKAFTITDVYAEDAKGEPFDYLEIDFKRKKVKPGEEYTGKVRYRPHEYMRKRGKLHVKTREKIYKPLFFNLYASVDKKND